MAYLAIAVFCGTLFAQRRAAAGASPPEEKPEEGIPVTNPLVIAKCGTCHVKDAKGNLSRISFERSTPEGWEQAIKRMVRLNGLTLSPEEAKTILKYLSTYHGLAPEEAKSILYMAEHRMVDETAPNDSIRTTCMGCHALGRGLSWRRSAEDWKYLANMHVFLYAQADVAFRRGFMGGGNAPAVAEAADTRPPLIDESLDYLAKNAPLHTPEWASWRARMRQPKMEGRWLVSAHIDGKGQYYGEMVVEPGASDDEFSTRVKLTSVKDGSTITRSGHSIVYAGYEWRGRSQAVGAAPNPAPGEIGPEMREAMFMSADQTQGEGRWFWGAYQEFGADVKLERASSEPLLLGLDRVSLKAGTKAQRVRVIGDSFPKDVNAADLDFGAGTTVSKIVSQTAGEIVAEVDVTADAVPGKRDVLLRRAVLQNALAIYDHIDYVKVTPETALSHLGSDVHPKGFQQFDVIAYNRGADGKAHTADDIDLGPVDVAWSVEEFYAVYGDDDKDFVGTLSPTGLFTPALDGPNPKRKFSRNNYGDIWVVATAKNEKDRDGNPLIGKSYLVVTVPQYVRWDQFEVAP
jgi:quinohemoprotein amine dehydrogenase